MANLHGKSRTGGARRNPLALIALILLICSVCVSLSTGQIQTNGNSGRKVVRCVEPDYSPIVKHAHIGGTVRLRATVLANGEVTKVEPLGGNAIFIGSASRAVLKWKYVPAAGQTKEDVLITFTPN